MTDRTPDFDALNTVREVLGRVVKAMDTVEFDSDLFRLKNRVAHLEDQTLRMRIVLGTVAVWASIVTGWVIF